MIRLCLHSEIAAAHSSHGVSHEDYNQYASYCTRKLSRLRHGKVVRKELLHSRLYKNSLSTRVEVDNNSQNGGGGTSSKAKHAYRAIDVTNLPSDVLSSHVNYFLEPLYCAERCWASSVAVRAEQQRGDDGIGVGSSGGNVKRLSRGKMRANSIKKLRKAVYYATLLETLTQGFMGADGTENRGEQTEEALPPPPVDEYSRMEARAYVSWMKGNLAVEQEKWQVACTEYRLALTICETIASGMGNINLELFDFFTTRAQNTIAPLLRYCQYELQVSSL